MKKSKTNDVSRRTVIVGAGALVMASTVTGGDTTASAPSVAPVSDTVRSSRGGLPMLASVKGRVRWFDQVKGYGLLDCENFPHDALLDRAWLEHAGYSHIGAGATVTATAVRRIVIDRGRYGTGYIHVRVYKAIAIRDVD